MNEKIERQRQHFDSIAERYSVARRDANHVLLKRLIWNEVFKDWQWRRSGEIKLLEAMCGYAEGKDIIADGFRQPVNYTGFDYSEVVVQSLKKRWPDLNVLLADVTRFQPTEKYDIVMLLGGLHHVPDAAESVVRRLTRSLVDGGYFINFEPTHGNALFRIVREAIYKKNSIFDEVTERAFSVEELFGFFANAGLALQDALYPGLLSYVLFYNPDAFPFLNIGGRRCVTSLFAIDSLFLRNFVGRSISFATLSVWRKGDFASPAKP